MSDRKNLAALTNGPTRRQAIVGVAMAFGGLTVGSTKAWDSSTRSYSSVESCSPCTWETSPRRSVVKWEARSRSSVATSRERHVEHVPNERIVQAWRTGGWAPGVYSIVKFELVEQGSGTKTVFDYTGFPKGEAAVLASGWKAHYWEPLEKLLA